MTPFRTTPEACCNLFSEAIMGNLVWYNEVEINWNADFFDSLEYTEEVRVISYCPFCGTELERPLDK